jgi:hypothetical protein
MSGKHNWTEPRVYTDPDGKPIRATIYDKTDAREVASVRLSRDDGPEHIAQVRAEFTLIAAAPTLAAEASTVLALLKTYPDGRNINWPKVAEALTAALKAAGIE